MTAAPTPAPIELPLDVRLLNVSAKAVAAFAALLLCAAGAVWLAQLPQFSLRSIRIEGEVVRASVPTIRANAAHRLAGNFFSLDLQAARAAFEAVPWVRHAVVRRIWPNRLAVRLEEHRAAAFWADEHRSDRLVNTFGEIFEANVGDVEDDGLPRFSGPDAAAPRMLAFYRRIAPVLEQLGAGEVAELRLSGRGSWRAELDGGAVVELGRGSEDEVLARLAPFVRTLPQVTGQYQRPLEYADLRHADGYAVRLKGVATVATPAPTRKR
jgi:cell division protein FtsQ